MSHVEPVWQKRKYASHEALAAMESYMRRTKQVATEAGRKAGQTLRERALREKRSRRP